MYLDRTSSMDLYFFAPMAHEAVAGHRTWLKHFLAASLGDNWFEVLGADLKTFRDRIDLLLRELAETSDSIRTRDQLMAKVTTWRSMMTSLARQAPPARRNILLQAAGYGLGATRSVKETKDLLVEVKARMALHADTFRSLGAADAMLALPAKVLGELEEASGAVAREKAEDSLARSQVQELQSTLVERFEQIGHAANAAAYQGTLLDDESMARQGQELTLHLTKALGEARVSSRRRAATGEVPADLMVENTVTTPNGDVATVPVGTSPVTGEG